MRLIVVDNHEAMSRVAARLMADIINEIPFATLVIAAGNTPLGTYRELAALQARGECDTSQVRPFQLDEYQGTPADDPRSLYGWVKRDFLDPLGIAPERLVRLRGDVDDLEAACREYDRAVEEAGGFDLSILGLGPNGHVGFNEPPADPHAPTRPVALTEASLVSNAVYWGSRSQVPLAAVTCGMSALLTARTTLLLVSGAHKIDILQKTIAGPVTPDVPSSYLQQAQNVIVVADVAAWPYPVPDALSH